MLQYEKLKKEEIKVASELAARAYFDYIYITIFFPGLKERQRGWLDSWPLTGKEILRAHIC